jgi:ribonuclease Z
VEEGVIVDNPLYTVTAFALDHTKPCFGYVFEEKQRPGEFHPEKAAELGIPMGPMWGKLQKGESVTTNDGKVITPEMVMGSLGVGGSSVM